MGAVPSDEAQFLTQEQIEEEVTARTLAKFPRCRTIFLESDLNEEDASLTIDITVIDDDYTLHCTTFRLTNGWRVTPLKETENNV